VKVIPKVFQRASGLAHCSLRSLRGLILRHVNWGSLSLHSGDALTLVRWRPPLRWSFLYLNTMTAGRIDSSDRTLRSRSAFPVRQVNRLACFLWRIPGFRCDGRRPPSQRLPLPGRGGGRSGGCGERGILAYPPERRKGGGVVSGKKARSH